MSKIHNININKLSPIETPKTIKDELPCTDQTNQVVFETREAIKEILSGKDDRKIMICGPCSIHDPEAAMEYANRLNKLKNETEDKLLIIMRAYFEKPRTTIGWKGLINDPDINGSFNITKGIKTARKLLIDINEIGLPIASEVLDTIMPQYIANLISWASIGARTTESQPHREMTSGLSMPVGFKNNTDGSADVAINAISTASHPHNFLGIDQDGTLAIVESKGNPWCHLILRGGSSGPNYDIESIGRCEDKMKSINVRPNIMIDCSHGNSKKKHENQREGLIAGLDHIKNGHRSIIGFMLESFIYPGNQGISKEPSSIEYGVSITDECIGWEETEELVALTYNSL
jgi:3-deoxy-7-phosphoheptulonate synthase